ncbi:hypothetical protein CHS0354_001461 [Potamilus streckersoni]|uniref:Uncharacterized protein n=1 Tax=Potamilus streckersoni TaxID=2493646 RepID=A0AAE0W9R5_9BIVA|nr:hypothetical protein CHS0354_001461 [Potamilus streckersoni]
MRDVFQSVYWILMVKHISINPLHIDLLKLFKLLLFLGATPPFPQKRHLQGKTALHCLGLTHHHFGFKKILELLLREECEIDEADCTGRTLLHYVTKSNEKCKSALDAMFLMEANSSLQDNCALSSILFCVLPSVFTEYTEVVEDKNCVQHCENHYIMLRFSTFLVFNILVRGMGIFYNRDVHPMQDAVCASEKQEHMIAFAFYRRREEITELDTESTDITEEAEEENSTIHSNSSDEAGFEIEDIEALLTVVGMTVTLEKVMT